MRLDHVSYVASHDQISDVVNRIGSQIGTAFVDGGLHPKFGTRNFTAPLLNGQYIEVVCPLEHPATDATPFGNAVKKKADAGGGWLTWVYSVDDLSIYERLFQRSSIEGRRIKPNGDYLSWNQIGLIESINNTGLPYFIEWHGGNHPSLDGKPMIEISKIIINSLDAKLKSTYDTYQIDNGNRKKLELMSDPDISLGIERIDFTVLNKTISIQ